VGAGKSGGERGFDAAAWHAKGENVGKAASSMKVAGKGTEPCPGKRRGVQIFEEKRGGGQGKAQGRQKRPRAEPRACSAVGGRWNITSKGRPLSSSQGARSSSDKISDGSRKACVDKNQKTMRGPAFRELSQVDYQEVDSSQEHMPD